MRLVSFRIALVSLLLFVFSSSVHSATSSSSSSSATSTASTVPLDSALLPQSFNNNTIQATPDFYRCFAPRLSSLAGGIGKSLSKKWSPDSWTDLAKAFQGSAGAEACPIAGVVEPNISCKNVMNGNSFSKETFNEYLGRAESALASYECQEVRIKMATEELNCLTEMASQFAQYVGALDEVYTKNIGQYKADIQTLETLKQERLQQLAEVNGYLGQGKDGKGGGLTDLLTRLRDLKAQVPSQITAMESAKVEVEELRRAKEEFKQMTVAADARACFLNRKISQYRCSQTVAGEKPSKRRAAPNASSAEFAVCIAEKYSQVSASGHREGSNANVKAQGEIGKVTLQTYLDQILAGIPTVQDFPESDEDFKKFRKERVRTLTFDEFVKQYSAGLKGFDVAGLPAGKNISDIVTEGFRFCFQQAKSDQDRSQNYSSKPIRALQKRIEDTERKFSAKSEELLTVFKRHYSDVMRAFAIMSKSRDDTALSGPQLGVEGCFGKPLNTQIGCLKNASNTIEGLISGSGDSALTRITLRRRNTDPRLPDTAVNRPCAGLEKCVTVLGELREDLAEHAQQTEVNQQNYINSANSQIESFTSAAVQSLSPQNAMLHNGIDAINKMLAQLGVSPGVKIPSIEPPGKLVDGVQVGGVALKELEPPKAINLIGGRMSPPMLNPSSNNFSGSLSGIARKSQEIGEDKSKASLVYNKVQALKSECTTESLEKLADPLKLTFRHLAEKNCGYVENLCSGGAGPAYDLGRDIRSLSGAGIPVEIVQSLQSGAAPLCFGSGTKKATGLQYERESQRLALASQKKSGLEAEIRSVKRQIAGSEDKAEKADLEIDLDDKEKALASANAEYDRISRGLEKTESRLGQYEVDESQCKAIYMEIPSKMRTLKEKGSDYQKFMKAT